MSNAERRQREQQQADARFERALDYALNAVLDDEKLWPLLHWLYFTESGYMLTSFGPTMEYREGQRSIGYALHERANRLNWAQWQKLKAEYERPHPPEATAEDE